MLKPLYPYYLANEPVAAPSSLEVFDKYTGKLATRVALADAATLDRALEQAVAAAEPMARMPAHQRQEILQHVVRRVEERKDELAEALCIEAGKPIRDSRGEVTRLHRHLPHRCRGVRPHHG
jgi:acyl-CoA reductase-like NAD-dependent aldehyde dehydrogenase